jgi:hypothetical protein
MGLLRNVLDPTHLSACAQLSYFRVSSPCCADHFLSPVIRLASNYAAFSPRVFRCHFYGLGVMCHVLLSCGGERRADGTFYNQKQQDFGNGVVCF